MTIKTSDAALLRVGDVLYTNPTSKMGNTTMSCRRIHMTTVTRVEVISPDYVKVYGQWNGNGERPVSLRHAYLYHPTPDRRAYFTLDSGYYERAVEAAKKKAEAEKADWRGRRKAARAAIKKAQGES